LSGHFDIHSTEACPDIFIVGLLVAATGPKKSLTKTAIRRIRRNCTIEFSHVWHDPPEINRERLLLIYTVWRSPFTGDLPTPGIRVGFIPTLAKTKRKIAQKQE